MGRCYLFDLDGTLCDLSHRIAHILKEPKDWNTFFAACDRDEPIPHVIELAQTLIDADKELVFVSGRSDQVRSETEAWLNEHLGYVGPLYMRKAGDHRHDDIVKSELVDQAIADGWEPVMAFEDRTRVVQMLRNRGIPCAQVAAGDF